MLDVVGNPEGRFSHEAAHIWSLSRFLFIEAPYYESVIIMFYMGQNEPHHDKTHLHKYVFLNEFFRFIAYMSHLTRFATKLSQQNYCQKMQKRSN